MWKVQIPNVKAVNLLTKNISMPELFLLTLRGHGECYRRADETYTNDIADAALFTDSETRPLAASHHAVPAIGPVDDAIEAAAARIKKLSAMASRMGLVE